MQYLLAKDWQTGCISVKSRRINMSVKVGSDYIAGNVALRIKDNIFALIRQLDDGTEYYNVVVPNGIQFGLDDYSRYSFIINGTNTTSAPIFRVGAVNLEIVNKYGTTLNPGDLVDGSLEELFVISLASGKIRIRSAVDSYGALTEKPRINGTILTGDKSYTDIGVAGVVKVTNDLSLMLEAKEYGSIKPGTIGTYAGDIFRLGKTNNIIEFLANTQPYWNDGTTRNQLATLNDLATVVIPISYKGLVTYSVLTAAELSLIDSPSTNATCLVTSTSKIYKYDGSSWGVFEELSPVLSDYYDVLLFDDGRSGKVTYNGTSWDIFSVQFGTNVELKIKYYPVTLLASGWAALSYTVPNIALEDGDSIIVYPAEADTDYETRQARADWITANIIYEGDDSSNEVIFRAEEMPSTDINIVIEVRK